VLLVTGITGHSGTYFMHELVEHGFRGSIRCVVREDSDHRNLSDSGLDVELLVGDLENEAFVDSAMVGVDVVLHIASIFYSPIVVAAAVRAGVSRIILVHTTGVYSRYKSASSEYKDIEQRVQTMLAPTTCLVILRPTMIYGYLGDRNMSVFIRLVDMLRLFPVIDRGKGLLQPVHGSDLGRAYYQVLMNPDIKLGEYVLSGERPVSMREMFAIICQCPFESWGAPCQGAQVDHTRCDGLCRESAADG